jgi:3-phenylpropionate/trans-cinnamate dioxygenase ferredoxin reductase subunit
MSVRRVVVAGGGHGGFTVCATLRAMGWDGELTLVDADERLPYQRPPLSKKFLSGAQSLEDTHFRPRAFYDEHDIDLVVGHRAVAIDRIDRSIQLDGRPALDYDHLVLATGARPRRLCIPGMDSESLSYLHVADHGIALSERITTADRVAIIGGGFIGLEVASMAARTGKDVTVFEAAQRLMGRAVSEPISRYYHDLHVGAGVDVRLSTTVSSLQRCEGKIQLKSADVSLTADVVVVGVGVLPNDELAAAADLATSNGIIVDAHLRTADPLISAIGDCARFPHPEGDPVGMRLESVQNATEHARHVAAFIAGGAPCRYEAVPWFWTEQHGRKLQMAGLTSGYDRTEIVESGPDKFSVYCYAGNRLLGCESVNSPKDHLQARKQLATERSASGQSPPHVRV